MIYNHTNFNSKMTTTFKVTLCFAEDISIENVTHMLTEKLGSTIQVKNVSAPPTPVEKNVIHEQKDFIVSESEQSRMESVRNESFPLEMAGIFMTHNINIAKLPIVELPSGSNGIHLFSHSDLRMPIMRYKTGERIGLVFKLKENIGENRGTLSIFKKFTDLPAFGYRMHDEIVKNLYDSDGYLDSDLVDEYFGIGSPLLKDLLERTGHYNLLLDID